MVGLGKNAMGILTSAVSIQNDGGAFSSEVDAADLANRETSLIWFAAIWGDIFSTITGLMTCY